MENYKTRWITLIILLGFLLSITACQAGTKSNPPTFPYQVPKQRGKYSDKEIFIARGTEQGGVTGAFWCGRDALVYYFGFFDPSPSEILPSHGIYWVDMVTKKQHKLANAKFFWGCTPDGKWLVYYSRHKGFWGYDPRTRRKQVFKTNTPLPPKGKQFRIRFVPTDSDSGKQKIKIFLLQRDYPRGFESYWLADYSGILVQYKSSPNDYRSPYILAIEMDTNGASKFVRLKTNLRWLLNIKIDTANNIYGLIAKSDPVSKRPQKRKLVKCVITGDRLKCNEMHLGKKSIFPYDISRDGRVLVYKEKGSWCIWLLIISTGQKECIVSRSFNSALFRISPNGKWLLYIRPENLDPYSKQHPNSVLAVVSITDKSSTEK